MATQSKEILVYAHWQGLEEPELFGTLYADIIRGKEVFKFEYDEEWLKKGFSLQTDPDLEMFAGIQFPKNERSNFSIFRDSSPDRWGRLLIKRKEALTARLEKRPVRTLNESDFLLGINDVTRLGGLRYKLSNEGPFLAESTHYSVPPVTSLPELQFAAHKVEHDEDLSDKEQMKWLSMILAPGSSLGGARPKAVVNNTDGNLWLAKFPAKDDTEDISAWEFVANSLAQDCGLTVPEFELKKLAPAGHTFLVKRFDRLSGKRIHFASAMTLLGYEDGNNFRDGISYLEIADIITKWGADIDNDLKELWRRILFSILISNTDDHLRNHGFLLTENGWKLSPVYDINPNPYGTGLSLNITDSDNSLDTELMMEVSRYFKMNEKEALKTITSFKEKVRNWSKIAGKIGLSKHEISFHEKAFRIK